MINLNTLDLLRNKVKWFIPIMKTHALIYTYSITSDQILNRFCLIEKFGISERNKPLISHRRRLKSVESSNLYFNSDFYLVGISNK